MSRLLAGIEYNEWGAPILKSPFYGRSLKFIGSMGHYISDREAYYGMWYKTDDGYNVYTYRRFTRENGILTPTIDRGRIEAYKTDPYGRRMDLQIGG